MTATNLSPAAIPDTSLTARCRETASRLVNAFAVQDIDTIMDQFAENSTYCDVTGGGQRGDEYDGKADIQAVFTKQFEALGEHTYEALSVMADGQVALASWILILGRADDPTALRFDGIDHFEMDKNARVVLKKGWLKGLSALPETAA